MGNAVTKKDVTDAIKEAIAGLEYGWNWSQSFPGNTGDSTVDVIDSIDEIDDLPDEAAKQAARDYHESVQESFGAAMGYLERARREIGKGNVVDALESIREAERLESEYGDSPSTSIPLKMVELLEQQIEDAVDLLVKVEQSWVREPDAAALRGGTIWWDMDIHDPERLYTPKEALQHALADLSRDFWVTALDRADVSEKLRGHLGLDADQAMKDHEIRQAAGKFMDNWDSYESIELTASLGISDEDLSLLTDEFGDEDANLIALEIERICKEIVEGDDIELKDDESSRRPAPGPGI